MIIRPERSGDPPPIHAVHAAVFPTAAEARLVDALRAANRLTVSLVAEEGEEVVGHVAFSPVVVAGSSAGLGLAPVGVLPARQRGGVGAQLVRYAPEFAAL